MTARNSIVVYEKMEDNIYSMGHPLIGACTGVSFCTTTKQSDEFWDEYGGYPSLEEDLLDTSSIGQLVFHTKSALPTKEIFFKLLDILTPHTTYDKETNVLCIGDTGIKISKKDYMKSTKEELWDKVNSHG